ncbi:hypothetical protein [Endozoicomonas sp. ONNA2]|uniref:hypothetical protein n=1 Tax=Endozoicomonas sp. ONNA2 TaxID=2828741 RepID=UPI002147743D|nr:hypothetical protein [Endozoicomonas sp. ONNA2]
MDRLSSSPPTPSANTGTDSADTANNSYFADRKIEINHKTVREICIDSPPPFNQQVNTLFKIADISEFSPKLDRKNEVHAFNLWFLGEHCPIEAHDNNTEVASAFNMWSVGKYSLLEIEKGIERGEARYICSCKERHEAYPRQLVSGVLTENRRLNEETSSKNVSALLSLAACNLIDSQRMLKVHEVQAAGNTNKSVLITTADQKRKESEQLLQTANRLDPLLTQNQIRSWIIQYAIHNNLINNAGDIEKIKDFRTTFQQKLSDQWFKLLTESGFYQNTELLAYPVILAEQLNKITGKLINANTFYPKVAYDSACLLFFKYDCLSTSLFGRVSFLPEPDIEHYFLFNALTSAIFDDEAHAACHRSDFMDNLKSQLEISRYNLDTNNFDTHKTKATTSSLKSWRCNKNSNEFKLQSVSVKTKKTKQAESTATWLLDDNSFPEPENLFTALATIFNVMTYRKPDDKTRIYNMPNHKKRITSAYNIVHEFVHSTVKTPNKTHGYGCFLLGWVQENQLIENSSPTNAAYFYKKATERGFFIPTGIKAGDLYVEVGDYPNACRCYEEVYHRLQALIASDSTGRAPEDQSGYLSESFQDFLESKIAYLKIRAKDTAYLRELTPDEIQRYINGEYSSPPTTSSESVNVSLSSDLTVQTVESANLPCPSEPCSNVTIISGNHESPVDGSRAKHETLIEGTVSELNIDCLVANCQPDSPKKESSKERNTFDCRLKVRKQSNPEALQAINSRKRHKRNLIRNRLTINWCESIHKALALFAQRQMQSIYTHQDNIKWFKTRIDRNQNKNGVEVLKEHLAWEHIHIAEQSRLEGVNLEPPEIKEHLNTARDLLLDNIIRKTGIQYKELPKPEKFESDVLEIIQSVSHSLKPVEIAEWLFGIVCQARSLGHVFSTFKMLYPGNQKIISLHRGWFSLKRLYNTPWEAVRE